MKLRKVARWCDAAEGLLAPTLDADRDGIVRDVESGRCELWEVNDGAAWLVTCVADGELAVCCVAGEGLPEIAKAFTEAARSQGLRRVRWFTRRGPGIQRILAREGLRAQWAGEVYTVELHAQRKPVTSNANFQH